MKKLLNHLTLAVALSVALFATSCKKTAVENEDVVTEAELKTQSDDQERFSAETDAVADDANAALENSGISNLGETPQTPQLPNVCDYTVAIDTVSNPRTITITYSGTGCLGNRSRSGKVIVSFAPNFRWAAAGASYTITYQNLQITRNADSKRITLNGTKTITNVSGGKLRNLATRNEPIIHEVKSSNMTITFEDGTQRTWNIAKRRTYTYANGIVIAISGVGSVSNGAAEWGVNRFDKEFLHSIVEPLVVKQSCNFRLVSGQTKHTVGNASSTVTFGLDAAGNAVNGCPSGVFYYKAVWTRPNGNTYTVIAPY
ncbi:MAG: hypothetical protein RL172_2112 [Bacteroidota bacterium]|jgi:hypothetical protein